MECCAVLTHEYRNSHISLTVLVVCTCHPFVRMLWNFRFIANQYIVLFPCACKFAAGFPLEHDPNRFSKQKQETMTAQTSICPYHSISGLFYCLVSWSSTLFAHCQRETIILCMLLLLNQLLHLCSTFNTMECHSSSLFVRARLCQISKYAFRRNLRFQTSSFLRCGFDLLFFFV